MASTYSMTWEIVFLTEWESRHKAGDYLIVGTGRKYGGGIRRTWKLYYRGTSIGEPSRLSEAKRDADYHRGVSR